MEIPIGAAVQCTDGPGGRSTHVVVNPITEQVTHVVVKEMRSPHAERLVPIRFVKATTDEQVQLDCGRDFLGRLKPFVETEFVRVRAPLLELEKLYYHEDEELMSLPYTKMEPPHSIRASDQVTLVQKVQAIPPGELAVRRGARVEATDGRVGRVDEFVVDPENGHITHLTMRKGHLWGDEDVSIPVYAIGRISESVVYLKLGKREIEALPKVKARRKWR